MDYLSSYTATLLEQSRFYFPPLAAMRNALQEARPPMALSSDSSSATVAAAAAAAAGVTTLAPFMDLGLLHGRSGPRGEREIPLDLSMKTIRQTPDSTADDDVVILEHRRNSARNHALQVAAAMAAGKLPFAFGAAPGPGGVPPPRLGDPFLPPPHPSLFPHDHLSPLLQPTPTTSAAASLVSSPAVYRCPQGSEGSSAFLTPPANLHAAVCGGLNGFCLDPHRCRLASLSALAGASSAGATAVRQHPNFQMPSPFSTMSSSSAAAAAAAAAVMYERQLAKLIPSSTSSGSASLAGDNGATSGVLPGLSDLHLSSAMPSVSSTSSTSTSSPSVDATLKHPFPTTERYLSSFALPSSLGLPMFHHQHHAHPKDVPVPCACCLPKSFPLPCVCCYPSATNRGFEPSPADGAMFNCCQPPTSLPVVPSSCSDPAVATQLHSTPKFEAKDKVKRDPSVTVTTPTGGSSKSCHQSGTKSHHHHHHHHHHQNGHCKSSSSSSGNTGSGAAARSKTTSSSPHPQTPIPSPSTQAPPCGSPQPTKDDQCQVTPVSCPTSPSPKRQPEGGRWIPHQHSHKDKSANKKLQAVSADAPSGGKTNKVFAPVVHIQPSPPAGQVRPKSNSPLAPVPLPTSAPSNSTLDFPMPATTSRMPDFSTVSLQQPLPPLPLAPSNTELCPILATPSGPAQSQPGEEPLTPPSMTSLLSTKLTPPLKQEADTSNDVRSPGTLCAQLHSSTPPLPPAQLHVAPPLKQEVGMRTPPLPPPALPKPTPVPATIGRWMLSPPTMIKSELEEHVSSSPKQLFPAGNPQQWDRGYAPEVATAAVVSPVVAAKKPNAAALEHPASPAEGCSPTSAEPKATELVDSVAADATNLPPPPITESSYISSLVGSPPAIAIKLQKDDQTWKLPVKRPHCDTDLLPSKKKRRKDSGVFSSLKDEQQVGLPEIHKSGIKRKLEDDSKTQLPVMQHGDEPPRFAPLSAVTAPTVLTPTFFQPTPTDAQAHLPSPLTHHLGAFQALANNCKSERSEKQASPPRPVPFPNGDFGMASPSKSNCSSSVVGATNLYKNSIISGMSDEKPNFLDRPVELPRLPPVGVTLVKTGHLGINQYKSSILNSVPKMDDTTAMLRLYYEQQKQLLQEGYAQRLLSEAGYKLAAPVPVSLAQYPLAAMPTSTTIATPTAVHHKPKKCLSSSSGKHLHHHHRHHHHHRPPDGAANAPHLANGTDNQQRQPSTIYGPDDENARDGDDEREEDGDERVKRAMDAQLPTTQDCISYKPTVGHVPEPEPGPKKLEACEAHVQGSNLPVSPAVASSLSDTSPSTTAQIGNGPSGLVPVPLPPSTGGRSETMKRLMINKALGETMLHRAARLGYLDVISHCLEAQVVAIDARDNAGNTPLHECCSRGHLEIARLLLQRGADPNASATGGIRPLHDAVENDQVEISRLLLSYGADPLLATYSGLTPLKLARSPVMLEFLKGHLADVSGESDTPVLPWQFHGSARFFDPWPTGYDPLDDMPSDDECSDVRGNDDDVDSAAALVFENP